MSEIKGNNRPHRLDLLKTTVDDNTDDRRDESTIETSDTIRSKRLLVYINETVKLSSTSALGRFSIVRETCTGVVQRIDKEK